MEDSDADAAAAAGHLVLGQVRSGAAAAERGAVRGRSTSSVRPLIFISPLRRLASLSCPTRECMRCRELGALNVHETDLAHN